jgi:hypothetical protein
VNHDPATGEPDAELAAELFALVERDQGWAFISDGIEVLSRVEIFNLARASLKYSRRVVRTLEKFMATEFERAESTSTSPDVRPTAKETADVK